MTPPLAVITNRLSTRNRRAGNWIDPLLAGAHDVIHLELADPAGITDVLRQCARAGVRTIAVNGGDGTAGLIFGGLIENTPFPGPPAVALLPGGKTNMTGAGWSLTGDPTRALQALLARHRAGTLAEVTRPRPVLRVQAGTGPPRYGAFFGAAEVVEGINFCRRHIYPLGLPNAASHTAAISVLLWRNLFIGGATEAITVAADGGAPACGTFFFLAATTLDLLLGMRPIAANAGDGLTYISIDRRARAILSAIPDVLRRQMSSGRGRRVARAGDLVLTFTGPYTLDGEMYAAEAAMPLTLSARDRLPFIQFDA